MKGLEKFTKKGENEGFYIKLSRREQQGRYKLGKDGGVGTWRWQGSRHSMGSEGEGKKSKLIGEEGGCRRRVSYR